MSYKDKEKLRVNAQRKDLKRHGVIVPSSVKEFNEIYNCFLKNQGSCCAICGNPEKIINKKTGKPIVLGVDHNHVTGQIRGLLCSSCNRGLGLLGDIVERIQKTLNYLKGDSNENRSR